MEQTINSFHVGLNLDAKEKFLQQGEYRYAQNTIHESQEGDYVSLPNEQGNEICASLPSGQKIIGNVLLDKEEQVIFSTDNFTSMIGIYNPSQCTYTNLITSTCLNFKTSQPIHGLFRIRKGCERVIYFTDRTNPYRTINLDDLNSYTDVDPATANAQDLWTCNTFNLSPDYEVPNIELDQVLNTGGQIKVGTVQFAIQYLDEDLNPSNWFYVTNPVPIVDESYNSPYGLIDGGTPVIDEPEDTSVATTSKSIQLTISNLDINQKYYRLAALHSTSTINKVSETWILQPQEISNTTQSYVYRGPDLNSDFRGALSDITIDNKNIDIVQTHAQADQALWLGGLRSKQYNFAEFQRAASTIRAKCVVKPVQVTNINNPGDPKNPNTYWDHRTFMPDEVYAFGIKYLFANGTWSPAFHIPGRPKNYDYFNNQLVPAPLDTQNVSPSNETTHLGDTDQPYWKVYNNSKELSTNEYLFSYYEVSNTYSSTTDCNNESIWGVDAAGNTLANTPIRHHKFPSRREIPTYDQTSDSINILGVEFDNVTYPHSDIVGHQYLYIKRDEFNKTVLDNGALVTAETIDLDDLEQGIGWSTNLNTFVQDFYSLITNAGNADAFIFPRFRNYFAPSDPTQTQDEDFMTNTVFFSPKTAFFTQYLNGDHFRLLSIPQPGALDTTSLTINISGPNNDTLTAFRYSYGTGDYSTNAPDTNVSYLNHIFVSPYSLEDSASFFNNPIFNVSSANTYDFYKLSNGGSATLGFGTPPITVATNKINREVYTSLTTAIYLPLLPQQVLTLTTQSTPIYSGDAFTVNWNWVDYHEFFPNFISQEIRKEGHYQSGIWIDSDVNPGMRSSGIGECSRYYQQGSIAQHVRDQFYQIDPDTPTEYIQREVPCEEFYHINEDYLKVAEEKPATPLSAAFDYCSDCQDSYPYRIRVSKRSYQEETQDNYRIFLQNDYLDLPGESGSITALFTDKDELYALTQRRPYFIPTRPQTIQTNEELTYLGTGERLSIPAKALASTTHSYGGTSHLFGVQSSEFGTTFISSDEGKIFHLSSNLDEISRNRMQNWFRNNLPLQIKKVFPTFPLIDHPTHASGAGFTTAYDPRHQRLIISKKDFRPIKYGGIHDGQTSPQSDIVFWDPDNLRFYHFNPRYAELDVRNPEFFEQYSWTISYSFPHKAWRSYHSYLPNFLWNDSYTFYSSNNTSNIWMHNFGPFQTYYDTKYDYIIDFISSPHALQEHTFANVELACNIERYDANTYQWVDTDNVFFNRGYFYNSYQTTGLKDITIKNDTFSASTLETPASLFAERVEQNWQMNNIRDYVTNYNVPLFTSNYADLVSEYPIDKLPNTNAYSFDKNPFQISRLRDHWVGCRLFFNPNEDLKITTDVIKTQNQISFR
jgi:hypothetical protein